MLNRIVIGLILAAVGITVIYTGSTPFYLWVFLASAIMSLELFRMAFHSFRTPYVIFGMIVILAITGSAFFGEMFMFWASLPVHILSLGVIIYCLAELYLKRLLLTGHPLWTTLRIVFLMAFTTPFVYLIRAGENGFVNTMFVCVCIWFTDSCAYFGGRFLGRNQMSDISPNKTWEGAVFGLLGTMGFAYFFSSMFGLDVLLYTLISLPLSILSQLGDLHESLTKRHFSVKDSSHILQGHGGIYDRADGYIFVMPIMFYFFNFIIG